MKTRSNVVWICSFPTSYRGSFVAHRNVNRSTPPKITGGQLSSAEMPKSCRPQQFWSQNANAAMPKMSRSKGRVQHPDAGYVNQMSILPEQITGGQRENAEMPYGTHPRQFYLVPRQDRRNAITVAHQGKGQDIFAEMPCNKRSSQPVTGVQRTIAEMPQRAQP